VTESRRIDYWQVIRRRPLIASVIPPTFGNVRVLTIYLYSMKRFIVLSLLLNIVVLIPVCVGLITDANWTQSGYGEVTAARGILLSIYLSILLSSCLLLLFRNTSSVAALLSVQIIYKITTPITVGTLQNPVVISNLGIALCHTVTLLVIWRAIGNPFKEAELGGCCP
jgi:hypothetical protein